MMTDSDVQDSPVGWVNRHVKAYVDSDGEKGHEWQRGVPTLLLTTMGRHTGTRHRTALIYGRDGEDLVVVASKGGSKKNPAWYLNLSADPKVDVQVGAEKFEAVARTATGKERARLWAMMNTVWRHYESYQKKTEREIPVIVLSRSVGQDA
jgi:deazaflavin-dependent oxidoreductase (nitroreductase family)